MRLLYAYGVFVCLGFIWHFSCVHGTPITFKWCSNVVPELNCSVYGPFDRHLLHTETYYAPVYWVTGYPVSSLTHFSLVERPQS
ncbi:glycoprotein 4 [Wobbly possum disease virus]|uniref:Glycoprotein 4 n=1 Tax=Wobbly possum disease virus TaxID=1118369 RepID=G9FGS1_9NIDO|nr:glycoprotein 4 [Wobbly possum disease virus]AEU12351.1 glycoprotein 4 [Wobbly possum disease virus]